MAGMKSKIGYENLENAGASAARSAFFLFSPACSRYNNATIMQHGACRIPSVLAAGVWTGCWAAAGRIEFRHVCHWLWIGCWSLDFSVGFGEGLAGNLGAVGGFAFWGAEGGWSGWSRVGLSSFGVGG